MSASFCLPSTHVAPQVPLWKALIILAWAREEERCDFFCVPARKISKINIFVSTVQPQEKYKCIGEEIKMMDLLVDMCLCVQLCLRALQIFLFYNCCIFFLFFFFVIFWTVHLEWYYLYVIVHLCFRVYVSGCVMCMWNRQKSICRKERPELQAVWGSREPLEIAGRGTDKAASHSSDQMKAVKLTGGTQALPQDGSQPLSGDLWLTQASMHAHIHTQRDYKWERTVDEWTGMGYSIQEEG